MTAHWMEHPNLVAWFDDLEDAVTTALALTEDQRSQVKAKRAPRADTWAMFARNSETRDELRKRLAQVQDVRSVPLASDCNVLSEAQEFVIEEDTFEQDHGFQSIEVDYIEEGSTEDVRRELISDADDYAASDEAGWFYAIMDDEYDPEGNPQ